ncbi:hypothetical protein [Brevibacterium paucivorans]
MGLTTSLILTTEPVTAEQLEAWGLTPTQDKGDLWTAFHDPANQFFAVARPSDWTILWDPEMLIAPHFETDSITLPGTWLVASTVSSMSFVDYRVFVDGTLVRHLLAGDEELNDGTPVVDESAFVFREEGGEEEPAEVDGDLLIQELPRAVGAVGPGEDVFAVEGQYFTYQKTEPHPNAESLADPQSEGDLGGGEKPQKQSFFGRLFGKK